MVLITTSYKKKTESVCRDFFFDILQVYIAVLHKIYVTKSRYYDMQLNKNFQCLNSSKKNVGSAAEINIFFLDLILIIYKQLLNVLEHITTKTLLKQKFKIYSK